MTIPFRVRTMLLSLLLLLWAGSGFGQPAPQKVQTFVSKDGRFSAQFPARPQYSTHNLGGGAEATTNHIYLLEQVDVAYYASYSDFDPAFIRNTSITRLLDAARDGGVKNCKGKLLTEKSISLDGNPGREIAIDLPGDPKTKARARFYMVGNRLFSIIFAGPVAVTDGAETDAFLASLKLQKLQALPNNWISVESSDGRFRIKMPAKPAVSIDSPGKKDAVHLWQLISDKDEVSFIVAYNDLPDNLATNEVIENALDEGREVLAKSMKATVGDQNLLSVEGNPGREIHMHVGSPDAPDLIMLFREFIVKNRYYQVLALGSKPAMEKANVDGYMASFQLIKSAAPKKP